MTDHPITPPPELIKEWRDEWFESDRVASSEYVHIATQAARWGADQELKACCEWMYEHFKCGLEWAKDLRAARRPEPSSKKHRALKALSQIEDQFLSAELTAEIRCALEELPDD